MQTIQRAGRRGREGGNENRPLRFARKTGRRAGIIAARQGDEVDEGRGRAADQPAEIPPRGWRDIGWRLFAKIGEDRAMLVAGGVTFYLILAIFPALGVFVSLFGMVADPSAIAAQAGILEEVLPDDGAALIIDQLTELAAQQTGTLGFGLAVSLAVALWAANNGVKAFFEAFNIAYGEQEKRSLVWLNLTALGFTLGLMLLVAVLLVAVGVVPAALAFINLGEAAERIVRLVRWLVLLPILGFVIALMYRYGPSREPAKWRWVTWGSGLATVVWLIASIGYSWYLENMTDYNATYGSLGAAIGFMLWIWLSALIVIVGAELNAEMELQTRRDTTTRPEQPMGERGAYVADTVGEPVD